MSERKPTEANFPVWAESPDWTEPEKPRLVWSLSVLVSPSFIPARSWKTAKDIPAPPKEQTQRERDEAVFDAWYFAKPGPIGPVNAWRAALAWERAEIAKLMDGVPVEDSCSEGYSKLRARLRP